MSGGDVLMECLRQLHPGVQFDRGPSFFLYILSVGTAVAGIGELLRRHSGALPLLLISLTLWLSLLLGNLLVVMFGEDQFGDTTPHEQSVERPPLPSHVAEPLLRARQRLPGRGGQLPNSVELPAGERWEVPLEKKDHDDAKG